VIEKCGKIIEKLDKIRKKLQALQTPKYVLKYFNDNKKYAQEEKDKINNAYNEMHIIMNKKKSKSDDILKYQDMIRKSVDKFLEIYGYSYESLFRIICEKNEILDGFIFDKEKEINKDLSDCFQNLKDFIIVSKRQIKESNNFLKINTRNFYKNRFEKVLKNILDDKKYDKNNQTYSEKKNKIKNHQSQHKGKSCQKVKSYFIIKNAITDDQFISDERSRGKRKSNDPKNLKNNNKTKKEKENTNNFQEKKSKNEKKGLKDENNNKKNAKNKSVILDNNSSHTDTSVFNSNNDVTDISKNNKDKKKF